LFINLNIERTTNGIKVSALSTKIILLLIKLLQN